jgi:hypothetical protein
MLNKIKFGTVAVLGAALLVAACASARQTASVEEQPQLRGRLPVEATLPVKGVER